ncbi:MAG: bifunctional DNA primase/polymerase [Anaerolineae bacterium]|nr:bifunctional DNA primase/polymerase [Anaerolineae bacterium]
MSSVLEAALAYVERGWSVLPCKGKAPAIDWSKLQVQRPPFSHVHEWHRRGYLQNVGVICGAVSNNLVVIDLDGLEAVKKFRDQFPRLLQTRTVVSGSGRGQHIYLQCETLPPTARVTGTEFGGFELRSNGSYVIAPPSRHPESGLPYYAMSEAPVMQVDQLDDVVAFIRTFQLAKRKADDANEAAAAITVITGSREQQYMRRAIDGELHRVRTATEGSRNNALFWAACHLGNLVAAGLNEATAGAELLAAALAVGLGEREAQRTIKSGFAIGKKYPRPVPDRSRRHAR